MEGKCALIVDDEKNILLTLSQSLVALGLETDTALNGEEALAKLEGQEFDLILLDLKMPGMDGIEVLRRVRSVHPDIRVVIITAHGTIESAVEAMKLGAIDFIQKPFSPSEIRDLVSEVMDQEKVDEQKAKDYESLMALSKRASRDRHFEKAIEYVSKAISLDQTRPEAFNLMGVLLEIRGDLAEARKNYHVAISLDPTYKPARENLDRSAKLDL